MLVFCTEVYTEAQIDIGIRFADRQKLRSNFEKLVIRAYEERKTFRMEVYDPTQWWAKCTSAIINRAIKPIDRLDISIETAFGKWEASPHTLW